MGPGALFQTTLEALVHAWAVLEKCWPPAQAKLCLTMKTLIQTSACRPFSWLALSPVFSAMNLKYDYGPLLQWGPLGVLLALPEGVALPLLLSDKKTIRWDYTVLNTGILCHYPLNCLISESVTMCKEKQSKKNNYCKPWFTVILQVNPNATWGCE